MSTSTIGASVLGVCALTAGLGSIAAEFGDNHVYDRRWPAAARRGCACFGLLNGALGLMGAIVLLAGAPWLAGSLLLLMDLVMLFAALFPGVEIRAEGERVIASLPMSYWMTFVHLALVGLGWGLCEIGS